MEKHAEQLRAFTIKAYEVQVIQNYMNIPLQTNKKNKQTYNFMARQQQQRQQYLRTWIKETADIPK